MSCRLRELSIVCEHTGNGTAYCTQLWVSWWSCRPLVPLWWSSCLSLRVPVTLTCAAVTCYADFVPVSMCQWPWLVLLLHVDADFVPATGTASIHMNTDALYTTTVLELRMLYMTLCVSEKHVALDQAPQSCVQLADQHIQLQRQTERSCHSESPPTVHRCVG